ncbi:FAD-binding oxidoreductase [Actinoplanes sp. NPDC026670]|uniref:FAD-binding oxidoreductase n=1 Tax=Actinoplanes sp. NPDC026670 TaxID=3154700 RepID=UPI0033E23FE8
MTFNESPISSVDRAWLESQIAGPVLTPDDPGYTAETATFNLTLPHRPAVVIGATHSGDVQNAVRFAARRNRPVSVNATGHGAVVSADGTVMITTKRMNGVSINRVESTGRIQAGVRWHEVISAAAKVGLAPMAGSSPLVGAVAYTLGGGLSPTLGRTHGYAADHVRSVELVTADGVLRHLTAEKEPDLFWAVRGGKGNFGVVTALEFDLFPITRLYGGGLYYHADDISAVLRAWRSWAATAPEELSTSFVLLRLPDLEFVPEPMRGRLTLHVRVSYLGPADTGAALVAPLRSVATPFIDTVQEMPFTEIASIHNDPTEPAVAIDRTMLLRDLPEEALETLLGLAGPAASAGDALMMVEVRLLGGALSRAPQTPNAVGNRDAGFNLFMASIPAPVPGDPERIRGALERLLDRMAPWGTGGAYANFLSTEDTTPELVKQAFTAESYRRLAEIKRRYDPANLFRINHNVPPAA